MLASLQTVWVTQNQSHWYRSNKTVKTGEINKQDEKYVSPT